MPVGLYMDHHVPRVVTASLRARGVDVLTAADDGTAELDDPALLDRASSLGRTLVSCDVDLLAEAARPQRAGIAFGGVVYARQRIVSIAVCVDDLELIAATADRSDLRDRVLFLPL